MKITQFSKDKPCACRSAGECMHNLTTETESLEALALRVLLAEHPALDYADELLAMVKDLSCNRGHAPGCSGEWKEHRCKCGWRELEPKAQALINEIEGKK